jgi:hypothetical protein
MTSRQTGSISRETDILFYSRKLRSLQFGPHSNKKASHHESQQPLIRFIREMRSQGNSPQSTGQTEKQKTQLSRDRSPWCPELARGQGSHCPCRKLSVVLGLPGLIQLLIAMTEEKPSSPGKGVC